MLCTHIRQLFAPAEARSCLFLGSAQFSLYCSTFRTFPEIMYCTHVRQLCAPVEARFCLFLGLPRFLFTAVLFPGLCSAVTIGNSTFGCFDIVCDQGRPLTSTLFERMMTVRKVSLSMSLCRLLKPFVLYLSVAPKK